MATERDLYEILGVPKTATQDELKTAFRKLARQFHPDVNPGNKQAEERFKEINAAFDVLSDPQKRSLYDELGADAIRIGFDPKQAEAYRQWKRASQGGGRRGVSFGDGQAFDFDFGQASGNDFSSIFETLFGGFGSGGRRSGARSRAAAGPVEGDDLTMEVDIPLARAVRGGEESISFERPARCGTCSGGGAVMTAGGRRVCQACRGTGQTSGEVTRLTVKIPPGVEEGSKIRLAGQGMPGQRGGPSGDLYLVPHIAPHPRVRVEGRDLYLNLPVTAGEAFFGGEVRCPTFDGNFTLKVPPHSQSGRKLRLRGLGLPSLKGAARGDFYAVLEIALPEGDQEALKKAIESVDDFYRRDVRAALTL